MVGHFALAAHCADTGAAVSGGDGGAVRVLAVDSYLWYGYYFPMLFIPLLCVLVALSLGKPENYRLPK